jgi:hypothetical protein
MDGSRWVNEIVFARRGKSDRATALASAIDRARSNFMLEYDIRSDKPISIRSAAPSDVCGLQAIDYFLWALQRLYERGEDRYYNYVAGHYRVIMDFDDNRTKEYGAWYTDDNPLTKQKMLPLDG